MIHAAYILHLDRATDRRDNVHALVDAISLPTAIHPATDGSALTAAETTTAYQRALHAPRYPYRLTPGEIGCFLSHRSLWERIAADGLDAALIMEDDTHIEPGPFAEALALACQHINELGYIKLPIKNRRTPIRHLDSRDTAMLFEQQVIALGTHCQIVSAAAAATLLAATRPFDRPIDVLLQLRHLTGQRIYTIYPNGISDISTDLGGSHIHQAPRPNFLTREFKRMAYRRAIHPLIAETFR